jgi:hypothetical protein
MKVSARKHRHLSRRGSRKRLSRMGLDPRILGQARTFGFLISLSRFQPVVSSTVDHKGRVNFGEPPLLNRLASLLFEFES